MNIRFLRSDVLRFVHAQLIQTYGGLPGVRNEDGLQSSVARPQQLHNYTGETRVAVLAASLAWSLLRNHPFVDGNKRIALAALVMSAELNEHRLTCSQSEETAMTLKARFRSVRRRVDDLGTSYHGTSRSTSRLGRHLDC